MTRDESRREATSRSTREPRPPALRARYRWRRIDPARFNLTGATSASVQFTYEDDTCLTGGESVTVQAWNHTTSNWETLAGRHSQHGERQLQCDPFGRADRRPTRPSASLANGNWDNGDNFFIDNFASRHCASGNLGVDTVNGDAGDDTIIWNANCRRLRPMAVTSSTAAPKAPSATPSSITGNATAETYRIYTPDGVGCRAGNTAAASRQLPRSSSPATARAAANVIAELCEIEEIRINGVDPAGTGGASESATPSRSSATSRAPACASTPSPSMAMPATTRSTSRPSARPTVSSSSPTVATIRSSGPSVPKT